MKKSVLFFAILGLSVSLSAQSLADLARQERARREGYKGRHAIVIGKQDLMRVRKVPGVVITYPEGEPNQAFEADERPVEPGTAPTGETGSAEQPAVTGEGSSQRLDLSAAPSESTVLEESAPGPRAGGNIAIEAQLRAARELVDLLTTKVNALRQQYERQDTMVPGYVIQEQLVETEKRLLKAQTQLARIEAQARK